MIELVSDTLIQAIATIGLAVILIIVGYRKITKEWQVDSAETSIITLMHKELERMSEQNAALSNEIGRLHQQIITLNRQIHDLSIENQRLQSEVMALTNEVSEFKASMLMKGREHATS